MSETQRRIIAFIREHKASSNTNYSAPSLREIARATNYSKSAVERAISRYLLDCYRNGATPLIELDAKGRVIVPDFEGHLKR